MAEQMIPLSVLREYRPDLRMEDLEKLGPIEYDQSKVPDTSRKHADNIRRKVYGVDTRESQARGVEYAGLVSSKAVDVSNETKGRQDTVESHFEAVQQETTNKDFASAPEIVVARNGEVTLDKRLLRDKQEVARQMAYIIDDNAISPDNFEGDDHSKVQQALDALSGDKSSIKFSRMYNITGKEPLVFKLNHDDRRTIYLLGVGGGIRKDDGGDIFTSDQWRTGDLVTSNMRFESVRGANTRVIDGNKIIRVTDFGSSFRNVDKIITSDTYLQSIYLNSSSIVGGSEYAISFAAAYDVNFNTILVEHRDSFMKQNYSNGDDTTIFKLTIRDSLIEGLEDKAISIAGKVSLMTIDGLYTEANKEGDIYFEGTSIINVLNINNYFSSMEANAIEKPAVKFSGNHENVTMDNVVFVGDNNKGVDLEDITAGWNYVKLNNVRHLSKSVPYTPANSNKVLNESSLPTYKKLSNPSNYDFKRYAMGTFDKVVGSVDLFWNGHGYHERVFDIGHAVKNDDIIGIQVHYYDANKNITIAHVGRTTDGKLLVKINNDSGNANVGIRLDISILTSIIGRPSGGVAM